MWLCYSKFIQFYNFNASINFSSIISTISCYKGYCIRISMHILLFNDNRSFYFSINSGAVESGKKYHCTPLQSLDCKEFSTGYWQWCHLFLLDAVRQFGYPSLFITISPSEWSFPQVCFRLTYIMLLEIFYHYEKNRLQNVFIFSNLMLQIFRKR